MANELRTWTNWIGGLVEDNPLAAAATTLTSAGLAALPAVGSTEHALIVFDPDGLTGAPYAKRVTAHTAATTTATIEAAAVIGTARAIDRDVPWVHSFVAEDFLNLSILADTSTAFSPVLACNNHMVTLSNASAVTVTLQQDSDLAFPVGGSIIFVQLGAGQVTFAAGTGATLNTTPTAKTRAQYSIVTAIKRAANTWILAGDLAAT